MRRSPTEYQAATSFLPSFRLQTQQCGGGRATAARKRDSAADSGIFTQSYFLSVLEVPQGSTTSTFVPLVFLPNFIFVGLQST